MNTNKIAAAWDIINRNEQDALWGAGNDDANGYPVGLADDSINGLDIGQLVWPSPSRDKVAVYVTANGIVAVGDANGPWAVQIG